MPDLNTRINTLADNVQQVRDSSSALNVDQNGELIRLNFTAKVARALVNLGIAREGRLGSRIVVAMVGRENFELLCQSSHEHLRNSIRNVTRLVKQFETQGLDDDLSKLVSSKISDALDGVQVERITGDSFKELHALIQDTVIPQRLAHREALTEALESGEATPTMKDATYRGVITAIAALEGGMEKDAVPYQSIGLYTQAHKNNPAIRIEEMKSGPTMPVELTFVRRVCGKQHDSNLLKRDIWDANKILGELRSVELDVRDKVHSEISQLKEQYSELQAKIVSEGATTPPTEVATWELQMHTLKSQIEGRQQTAEDEIKAKVAGLKENLLAALKESVGEKEASVKLLDAETQVVVEPKSPREGVPSSILKPAQKEEEAATGAVSDTPTPAVDPGTRKRRIRFGAVEVQDIGKSYLHAGFKVNDTNRGQWVQMIEKDLVESKGPEIPNAIAEALAQRGKRGSDDLQTMQAISLLRTHPVFLKEENFEALMINFDAAVGEERKLRDKFPNEVKQNYREHAAVFQDLAQRRLDATNDLLTHLNDYNAGLKKLDADPQKRTAQLAELKEQLGEYKAYFEEYEEVFNDPEKHFRITEDIGGSVVSAISETRHKSNLSRLELMRVIADLDRSPVFVDK